MNARGPQGGVGRAGARRGRGGALPPSPEADGGGASRRKRAASRRRRPPPGRRRRGAGKDAREDETQRGKPVRAKRRSPRCGGGDKGEGAGSERVGPDPARLSSSSASRVGVLGTPPVFVVTASTARRTRCRATRRGPCARRRRRVGGGARRGGGGAPRAPEAWEAERLASELLEEAVLCQKRASDAEGGVEADVGEPVSRAWAEDDDGFPFGFWFLVFGFWFRTRDDGPPAFRLSRSRRATERRREKVESGDTDDLGGVAAAASGRARRSESVKVLSKKRTYRSNAFLGGSPSSPSRRRSSRCAPHPLRELEHPVLPRPFSGGGFRVCTRRCLLHPVEQRLRVPPRRTPTAGSSLARAYSSATVGWSSPRRGSGEASGRRGRRPRRSP